MGLPADVATNPMQLLAGPYHPAFGHLVYERLYLMAAKKMLHQSKPLKRVTVHVHPKGVSTMRGLHSGNITHLTHCFCLEDLQIVPDETLERYQVAVDDQWCSIFDAA